MSLLKVFCFVGIALCACTAEPTTPEPNTANSLETLPDSTRRGDITIHHLFKHQLLAHAGDTFDSMRIVERVYYPHRILWDSCYGMIFGTENAPKFQTAEGMVAWNRTLYPEKRELFDRKVEQLLAANVDSVLDAHLVRFEQMVAHPTGATISLLFTLYQGIGFGGCRADQFALELNNTDYDIPYTIDYGIPHELNHFAYEPLHAADPMNGTALALAIDEGFACYFTWLFFDKKMPKRQFVEEMTDEEWAWYERHEQEIFEATKDSFADKSGENPLLDPENFGLFPEAPKTLYYWLGFRMVESYVERHGPDSWQDIYELPVREVLLQSGYAEKFDR